MAGELLNSRIPGLPLNAALKSKYLLAVYNDDNDLTERVALTEFLTSTTTGNFEYLPDTEYAELDVVTWKGEWWQAIDDVPENIAPDTDELYWEKLDKSGSGFVYWAAGVFPQDNVFVLYNLSGVKGMYELVDPTRPYVSTNFEDELTAGDWELLFSNASTPSTSQFRGAYDASTNVYPTTGGSGSAGALVAGDEWVISVANSSGLDGNVWPTGSIIKYLGSSTWRIY